MKRCYNFICKKCGQPYSLYLKQWEYNKGGYKHFCSRSCANSRIMTDEVKQKISNTAKNHVLDKGKWGAIKFSDYKTYFCRNCNKSFTMEDNRDIKSRKFCSQNCLDNWRHNSTGGYREGSGRSKSGWYKGIYCGSTWELAFLIYHLDNNLNIKRCIEKREYVFEGKIHSYLPDFVTDDGIIEIKGYISKNWEAKYNFNPDIKVLYKKDIKKYLDYVHNKYGRDLTSLYDNSNPKQINKKRVWIHKGSTNTWVTIDKLQRYLDNGYIRGQYIKSK